MFRPGFEIVPVLPEYSELQARLQKKGEPKMLSRLASDPAGY